MCYARAWDGEELVGTVLVDLTIDEEQKRRVKMLQEIGLKSLWTVFKRS